MFDSKEMIAGFTGKTFFLNLYTLCRHNIFGSHILVLLYHRVGQNNYNWSLPSLDVHVFEKHVSYLVKNFEIVSLEKLYYLINKGEKLSKKIAVITFDDGYRDNYIYSFPILKKYGINATIFLTSGIIGKDNIFWWDQIGYLISHTKLNKIEHSELGSFILDSMESRGITAQIICDKLKNIAEERKKEIIQELFDLTKVKIPKDLGRKIILDWEQIKEMSSYGIEFGSHSINHTILTNLTSFQDIYNEIYYSKKEIENKIDKNISSFSYPNGNYNEQIIKILKQTGYKCAVTIEENLVSKNNELYRLPRINVETVNFNKFRVKISGLYSDIYSKITTS